MDFLYKLLKLKKLNKNILLKAVVIFTLFFNQNFAQEIDQLKLSPNGVEPIVVEVEGLSASDLYNKAQDWVQETYKNPDKVLKANIENEKIRVNGFASNAWWFKTIGITNSMDMEYSIEVSFKDGKYRFEFTIGQFYANGGHKAMYTYSAFYKKNGEIRKTYIDAIPSLEHTMNSFSLSFYNYVNGTTEAEEDDW